MLRPHLKGVFYLCFLGVKQAYGVGCIGVTAIFVAVFFVVAAKWGVLQGAGACAVVWGGYGCAVVGYGCFVAGWACLWGNGKRQGNGKAFFKVLYRIAASPPTLYLIGVGKGMYPIKVLGKLFYV